MESAKRQALPHTLHFVLLLGFTSLDLVSTKNQDAILGRISGSRKGELLVVNVGGLGIEDLSTKNVMKGM